MDAVNMTPGNSGTAVKQPGVLYSLMLIAAMAVIVFSVAGIITMMGWTPGALSTNRDPARAQPVPASKPARPNVVTTATDCRDCGVIESLHEVEQTGEGVVLGVVAGGGAHSGHEIEKRTKKSVRYEIRIRMSDGSYRTLYEPGWPALTVGQKVRVTEQGVIAAG